MTSNTPTTIDLNDYDWEDIDSIKRLVEPVLLLDNSELGIEMGCSKFGGTPHLPNEFKWPQFNNRPMVFLAQVNLAEIEHTYELPKSGILYFFSFFEEPENEFGAEYDFVPNRESYKVLYFNGNTSDLRNMSFPEDLCSDFKLEENRMSFTEEFQIPPTIETVKIMNAGLNEADLGQLFQIIGEQYEDPIESILGTPQPIQYGVEYDWARALVGDEEFNASGMNETKLMSSFINLLSFPMMYRCDSIGDSNCYFGISSNDLINLNFDKAVFVMQGT